MLLEGIDLNTFQNKDTLNPEIFDIEEDDKMKIEVKETLLDVAGDFFNDLKVKVQYEDIWLVGSNANYNWSDYSDVDVHIVLPYKEVTDDYDLLSSFFEDKKNLWNTNHDIKIGIYEIEMYVQDSEDKDSIKSGGIYSILYDTWIRHPELTDVNIDVDAVQESVSDFMSKFKDAMSYKDDPKEFKDKLEELSDYLYNQRQKGLNGGGEFSPENIAFKYLRRKGVNGKIKQLKYHAYDVSKNVSHGTTLGSYENSKKQRQLSGNKNYVDKMDNLTNYEDKKKKRKDLNYSDGISYSIHGVLFSSLRNASKKTGEKKSTIQYRVHSKNPKYSDYKIIYKK